MANEQDNKKAEQHEEHKHESWIKHVVDEVKEEIAELTEEAQNMNPDEFPMLGNGHVNVVHDHHHDHDKKEDKEDKA